MADGPLLLVRSAPRLRLGSFMPASERQHPDTAVRNPPFAGVILAKAAFFEIDNDKSDRQGRNINIDLSGSRETVVKERCKTPFMISAYSSSNA
jgi:hypothetical protein